MDAIMSIAAVEFTCPTCEKLIMRDHDDFMFETWEIPDSIRCNTCDVTLKIPAEAKELNPTP